MANIPITISSTYANSQTLFKSATGNVTSDCEDPMLTIQIGNSTITLPKVIFKQPEDCAGFGSGTGEFIVIETPAGTIDGVNTVFTTSLEFVPQTVEVYINGVRQLFGVHYSLSTPSTITLVDPLQTGEEISVQYSEIDAAMISILDYIVGDIPSGAIDGVNATFVSTYVFIPETLQVWVNGIRQEIIADFTIVAADTIVLNFSPDVGEDIEIDYVKL